MMMPTMVVIMPISLTRSYEETPEASLSEMAWYLTVIKIPTIEIMTPRISQPKLKFHSIFLIIAWVTKKRNLRP